MEGAKERRLREMERLRSDSCVDKWVWSLLGLAWGVHCYGVVLGRKNGTPVYDCVTGCIAALGVWRFLLLL